MRIGFRRFFNGGLHGNFYTLARTGDSVVTIDFDRTIGEGYLKGGDVYATTNQAVFIFKDGTPYTFYPLLKAE